MSAIPCNKCGELIYFMKTKNNKLIPVNKDTIAIAERIAIDNDREVLFDKSKGHQTHFDTCQQDSRYRELRKIAKITAIDEK